MRLSEVIKELEKDGTKIFVSDNLPFMEMKCKSENESIEFFREGYKYEGSISFRREWEEIKQPLTFDEVMDNSKPFRCEHPKIQKNYYWVLSTFIQMLYAKCFDSVEMADIIQKGKFYN